MLVVLFGLAGSGKNYAGKLLSEKSDFHFWDADEALTDEMKVCISEKRPFTQDMRDRYVGIVIEKMKLLHAKYPNVVIAQALYKNKNREQILQQFPEAVFIQVKVGIETLTKRLRQRNNAVDEAYARLISANFEVPVHPYYSIQNDVEGDAASLIKEFTAIAVLNSISPIRRSFYAKDDISVRYGRPHLFRRNEDVSPGLRSISASSL